MTRDDLAALDRKVDLLLELMCPKCGPAAIVRMHPELGPQTMRPGLPNGHDHPEPPPEPDRPPTIPTS